MTARSSRRELLVDHVGRQVGLIQAHYARGPGVQPTSTGAQAVASLRRLDPDAPGDDPAGWGLVLQGMPGPLQGGEGADGQLEPSRAEAAAHAALCLYAVHQQGHTDDVHRRGARPGRAFGALARARALGDQPLSMSVVDHVHAAGAASSTGRRIHALRTLATLLRGETGPTIQLDYGHLARDLYDLSDPRTAPGVRLTWGRDLHHRPEAPSTPSPISGEQ